MNGIILNSEGDFELSGGIATVGDSTAQTIENILKANRGEFKGAPIIGGEVTKMINGLPNSMWCATLKKQIKSVGISISGVSIDNNEITITK